MDANEKKKLLFYFLWEKNTNIIISPHSTNKVCIQFYVLLFPFRSLVHSLCAQEFSRLITQAEIYMPRFKNNSVQDFYSSINVEVSKR